MIPHISRVYEHNYDVTNANRYGAGWEHSGGSKQRGERGIKRASETHNFQQVDLNSSRASERGEHAVVVRPVVSSIRGRERQGGTDGRTEDDGEEGLRCCDAVKRIGVNTGRLWGGTQSREITPTATDRTNQGTNPYSCSHSLGVLME